MNTKKWVTTEEYRKMSPTERKIALDKEFERTKDMSLNELYAELGSIPKEDLDSFTKG